MVSNKLRRLFLLLPLTGLIHIAEQWLYGFEIAFADVATMVRALQAHFANPNKAFLFLIAVFMLAWLVTLWAAWRPDRWAYTGLFFFGIFYLTEIHHLLRTVIGGFYYPGTATGILMVVAGSLVLWKGTTEVRQDSS